VTAPPVEEKATVPPVPGFQARLLPPRVSLFWWAERRSYLWFLLRELTSVFVAWFVAYLLLLAVAVGRGADAYQRFLDWSATPVMIALNAVALVFVVFHAVTFFYAAPQTTVVRLRGQRVPAALLAVPLYLAWAVVSAFLLWLLVVA
jgi:fumarate reductase subunit C